MYPHKNLDSNLGLPWNETLLIHDLELEKVLENMSKGDSLLYEISKKVLLNSECDEETILYRQSVLKDCIKNPSQIREVYDILVRSIKEEKRESFWFSLTNPELILHESIKVLKIFINGLGNLRKVCDESSENFQSKGFKSLFLTVKDELNDDYLSSIENHLKNLSFTRGVPISVELGQGNKGTNYTLLKMNEKKGRLSTLISAGGGKHYTFILGDRDESGALELREMRNRGEINITNIMKESAEQVLGFFDMLRTELAFYMACLNLYEHVTGKGEPLCFPVPIKGNKNKLFFNGLYDISLSLELDERAVGNDLQADSKDLIIITGTNRGGKSTFLRSVGQAYLMMQSGMYVPALSFSSDLRTGIFTHFKREEDKGMNMGKLDEELYRMSNIVDHLTKNSLVLFNESFSATNTREGTEISRNIVNALIDNEIKVLFVSHLYEFSISFYEKGRSQILFLRAERKSDGIHTYKIIEGSPLETSHSEDLFNRLFQNT
jgi:DNA mismatch repair ATPase MutS